MLVGLVLDALAASLGRIVLCNVGFRPADSPTEALPLGAGKIALYSLDEAACWAAEPDSPYLRRITGGIFRRAPIRQTKVLFPECSEATWKAAPGGGAKYLLGLVWPDRYARENTTIRETLCYQRWRCTEPLTRWHSAYQRWLARGGEAIASAADAFHVLGMRVPLGQLDWLELDLARGTVLHKWRDWRAWPHSHAHGCDEVAITGTSTTTTLPPNWPPGSDLASTTTTPPCENCQCKWQCVDGELSLVWTECASPCVCPDPNLTCDQTSDDWEAIEQCATTTTPAPCSNWCKWTWHWDNEEKTVGHWSLDEDCGDPDCECCYPEFCCDDAPTGTTPENECNSTRTQCRPRTELEQEPCPQDTFPPDSECTTSTTTTEPQCTGNCTWRWVSTNEGDYWQLDVPCTPSPCQCCYPMDQCGQTPGETIEQPCIYGDCPNPQEAACPPPGYGGPCGPYPEGHPCCDTTTTSSTTTTQPCCGEDCERCEWKSGVSESGYYWALIYDPCSSICRCPYPDRDPTGPCDSEQTECGPYTTTTSYPTCTPCAGYCYWIWTEAYGWVIEPGSPSGCEQHYDCLECEYQTWSGGTRRVPCAACQCEKPSYDTFPCIGDCVWVCQNGTWVQQYACSDFGDGSGCQCAENPPPGACTDGARFSAACTGRNNEPVCGARTITKCKCICPQYDCTTPP